MKVQSFEFDYGEGEKVQYILFASGTIMFYHLNEWMTSRLDKETLVENCDVEFTGWIEAPCTESI